MKDPAANYGDPIVIDPIAIDPIVIGFAKSVIQKVELKNDEENLIVTKNCKIRFSNRVDGMLPSVLALFISSLRF